MLGTLLDNWLLPAEAPAAAAAAAALIAAAMAAAAAAAAAAASSSEVAASDPVVGVRVSSLCTMSAGGAAAATFLGLMLSKKLCLSKPRASGRAMGSWLMHSSIISLRLWLVTLFRPAGGIPCEQSKAGANNMSGVNSQQPWMHQELQTLHRLGRMCLVGFLSHRGHCKHIKSTSKRCCLLS